MKPLIRHLLLTPLLLCSCVTSRKVEDYLEKAENQPVAEAIVSDWLEQNREWYAAKAAKDFPAKDSIVIQKEAVLVPLFIKGDPIPQPERPALRIVRTPAPAAESPDVSFFRETIKEKERLLQQNKARMEAARAALAVERRAHSATKQRLKTTKAERDYYEEKNRKKVWALVAMGIFAALYIIFKVAASRVRVS